MKSQVYKSISELLDAAERTSCRYEKNSFKWLPVVFPYFESLEKFPLLALMLMLLTEQESG